MPALAIGQSSSCSNPVLDIYFQNAGVLSDVFALEYQIIDSAGVQVFPTTPDAREVVPQSFGSESGAGRISKGHYAAGWTVPAETPVGGYHLRWFYQLGDLSPWVMTTVNFDVTSVDPGFAWSGYCNVSDLRREGVTEQEASDARLLSIINEASAMIDKYTGFTFRPSEREYFLDGYGTRALQLEEPIVAIDAVFAGSSTALPTESYRVYNRHITQRMRSPDDRYNPKLELVAGYRRGLVWDSTWPSGRQNIVVRGLFGFTEPDGYTSCGVTPAAIKHACMLMVLREVPLLTDDGARQDALNRWRLAEERTRDQSYRLSTIKPRSGDMIFTGDPEIDGIISLYRKPMGLGAV